MKKRGLGIREQGLENTGPESQRLERLLREALSPIGDRNGPERDLWPAMLRKFDQRPLRVPWFDWALIGALVALIAAFPAAIPVLMYYL